ncbi:MAG: carbohydrate-binding family 9-like protein [Cellulosilyticaceae bacterium]
MEKSYTIYDFGNSAPDWSIVPKVIIDEFPWYQGGKKQLTYVQCNINHNNICLRVESMDEYIRGDAKSLNEAVYNDSCFEFFLTPNKNKGDAYFNIEINCNGILYLAYKDNTPERLLITEEQADHITIEAKRIEGGWALDVQLPLEILESMCGYKIEKHMWHGNFYRCGGREDTQYACWNKIEWDYPSYHLPKTFGTIIISNVDIK